MFATHLNVPSLSVMRQFIEVADQRGFARAAKSLNISQPTLSKNLKRLEDTLGVLLMVRHTKGIELTRAGEALYQRAQNMILEYEHALHEINSSSSGGQGVIRIGAGSLLASTIIPKAIPRFHNHYPRYRISVETMQPRNLANSLLRNQISLGIGALLSTEGGGELHYQPVRRAKHAMIAGKNHPLAGKDPKVVQAEISRFPFVSFGPDQELVAILVAHFKKNRLPPPSQMVETNSLMGALELLRSGQYVMFSSSLFAQHVHGGYLVDLRLPEQISEYEMGFIFRPGTATLPPYRGFMNIVRSLLRE